MVCPLCEHVQDDGKECEECGIRLEPASAAAVEVPLLAQLEPTRLPAVERLPILPLLNLERGREPAAPGRGPQKADIYLSDEERVQPRCPNCALPGKAGSRCVACGGPLPH
jgi:hypothetical protein